MASVGWTRSGSGRSSRRMSWGPWMIVLRMGCSCLRWRVSDVEPGRGEAGDHVGVAVVEEEAGAGVQSGDLLHLHVAEDEVEHVEVLDHPLPPDGLRYGHDVALEEPAQHNLGNGL